MSAAARFARVANRTSRPTRREYDMDFKSKGKARTCVPAKGIAASAYDVPIDCQMILLKEVINRY